VDSEVWTDEAVGYSEPPVPHGLTWFRARLVAVPDEAPQVSRFLLNTVTATAAVTRIEEVLGTSNGRPGQQFTLRRKPVLVLPDAATGALHPQLELVVDELGQPELWTGVDDFFGVDADKAVYVLDAASGQVTFGDGIHGRIPVAGAEVKAQRYRYGGGQVGNAGADTISALRSVLPTVDKVTNMRPAAGGADAEPLSEVILRAPHDLRTRDRAVTQADFAELALRTPGVRIQRAYALARTAADLSTQPPTLTANQAGAVTVVILPENKDETPQPTEDQLRLVCDHLNSRRLITTELYVVGPTYLAVTQLEAEVLVSRSLDLKAVSDALSQRLLDYFHPLRGGEDSRGWPFGQDIYLAQVYRQLLNVDGVTRVQCLAASAGSQGPCTDVLAVPDGALVHLPRTAIHLKVSYDPTR
jgi:predicted phage baseplate assembly protein